MLQLNPKHMATTTQNANAQRADLNQAFRRAMAGQIAALNGQRIDHLVPHNDLVGTWQNADPNRAYAGLVPVIGGQERFDLALLRFDLLTENIPTYPNADGDVEFMTPQDALHVEARRLAAQPNATYQTVFDGLVTMFQAGGVIRAITYPARNRRGGAWQAVILGIDRV